MTNRIQFLVFSLVFLVNFNIIVYAGKFPFRSILFCFSLFFSYSIFCLFVQVDVCNPYVSESDWPTDILSQNTKLNNNVGEYAQVNATNLFDCARMCCEKLTCNFAFLKESSTCFLITCANDELCKLMPNTRKSKTDPLDYMIRIRSAEDSKEILQKYLKSENNELDQIKNEILNSINNFQEDSNKCDPSNSNCPLNELCVQNEFKIFDCVCPRELNFFRIDGLCREYLPKSPTCRLILNECSNSNEECIVYNQHSKHGTCQCKVGYKRNLNSFTCEPMFKSSRPFIDNNVNDQLLNDHSLVNEVF